MTADVPEHPEGPPLRDVGVAQVFDWVEGRLDADAAGRVAAAVGADDELASYAEWFRSFLADAQAEAAEESPPVLRPRLEAIGDPASQPGRQVVASVVVDTRRAQLTGVRSAGRRRSSFRLECEADDHEIVVDLSDADGRLDIHGQVLSPDDSPSAFEVAAMRSGSTVARNVSGDSLGGFDLLAVPADVDALVLSNAALTIRVALDG